MNRSFLVCALVLAVASSVGGVVIADWTELCVAPPVHTLTPEPTPREVPGATLFPTKAPITFTASPSVCIPSTEINATNVNGNYAPADDIITIVQQSSDGSSVTFAVHQQWKLTALEWLATEYTHAKNGTVCVKAVNVPSGPISGSQLTAACQGNYAVVKVYAHDDCFSQGGSYTVPQPCGGVGTTNNVAVTFRVPCSPGCAGITPLSNPIPTAAPTKSPTRKPTGKPSLKPSSKPTSKPNPVPTRTPTRKPTSKPTSKPSRKPTSKPNPLPTTMAPTRKPTSMPSAKPSSRPTAKPSVCVPLMEVKGTPLNGNYTPAADIVRIVQQSVDGSNVTFMVNQEWKLTALKWLATSYQDVKQGTVCVAASNVPSGALPAPYTAVCQGKVATVTVYAQDDCFSQVGLYSIPQLCGAPGSSNNVAISFKIPCSPGCPGVTPLSNPVPTRAPTRKPTSKPNSLPTRTPTRKPTSKPTSKPSRKPTSKPSAKPSARPTAKPSVCVPLMEVKATPLNGNYTPAADIVRIVQQSVDGSNVTFMVNQEWKLTNLEWLATSYQDVKQGTVCIAASNVPSGARPTPYTAVCQGKVATVTVYAHDDCFSQVGPYSIPQLCSPSGSSNNVAVSFKVPCSPGCPGVTPLSNPVPTRAPTRKPTSKPNPVPTRTPTRKPTSKPSSKPTSKPNPVPTRTPTRKPTSKPSSKPTSKPNPVPTSMPTRKPTTMPTRKPTSKPTSAPQPLFVAQETSLCGNGVLNSGEMCESDANCPVSQICSKCQCIPPPCPCGQKTETIEGDGKVTGGGWIYLTEKTYYNAALICNNGDSACNAYGNTNMGTTLNQTKANYGFNAMWRNGLPRGSTNFDFNGGLFHFHSTTGNTPYKFLEVMPDGIHARWMGTGTLSTKLNPRTNDWKKGYCFMVAVQDHGEPGADDTWRLRIWDCKAGVANNVNPLDWTLADFAKRGDILSYLVFDTNFVPNSTAALQPVYSSYISKFPLPNVFQATDPGLYRFNGTNVGELSANGGGNIQIHLKGKSSNALNVYIENNGTCQCANTAFEGDGNGFVTGGGWVYLSQTSYLKDTSPCADASCEVEVQSIKANFGFNAKFIGGVPRGSTNFNVDGKKFHFHTATGGQPEYDGLEVVCADTPYGKPGNGVYARWTGVGKVARTLGQPADSSSDWKFGYRFYVSVQDNGEPGMADTWRIRILDLDGTTVLFDTDSPLDADAGNAIWKSDPILCCPGCNNANSDPCRASTWVPSFIGDGLGEDYQPGGGNIQVHCKGGPT